MSTIGELERRAGIGSSPQDRTAFWIRFHHLDGAECLKAGVTELKRLIAEKEATPVAASNIATTRPKREKLPPLTEEEEQLLQAYAVKHGRRWKSVLNHVWMGALHMTTGARCAACAIRTVRPGFTPIVCRSRAPAKRQLRSASRTYRKPDPPVSVQGSGVQPSPSKP